MTEKAHMIRVEDQHVIDNARVLARIFSTQQLKQQDRRHLPGFLLKTRWSIGEATGAAVDAVFYLLGSNAQALGFRAWPAIGSALIQSHRQRSNRAARLRGLRPSSSACSVRPRQLVKGRRVAARQPVAVRHSAIRGDALRIATA